MNSRKSGAIVGGFPESLSDRSSFEMTTRGQRRRFFGTSFRGSSKFFRYRRCGLKEACSYNMGC